MLHDTEPEVSDLHVATQPDTGEQGEQGEEGEEEEEKEEEKGMAKLFCEFVKAIHRAVNSWAYKTPFYSADPKWVI